jgi:hypothetical protein
LTVAIHKKVRRHANQDSDAAQPVFAYDPSKLAPVIVTLWNDASYPNLAVLQRNAKGNPTSAALAAAKAVINTSTTNFNLERPVIITEAEHDADWYMDDDTEVVFVLPNKPRVASGSSATQLLETAKLLMACTPNGI